MSPQSSSRLPSDHGPADKPEKPEKSFVIHVDRKQFRVDSSHMTGAEVRALAGLGTDVDLYLESHGDEEDDLVEDAESMLLKNGMHFFSTPRNITPGRV